MLSTNEIVGTAGVENQIPTGAIVLYQTDAGRFGKFEIQNYDRHLTIRWVTLRPTGAIFNQGSNVLLRASFTFDLDSGLARIIHVEKKGFMRATP